MSAAPLVVAAVPVFNGMRFLDETLASIAAQDYPNLKIVISDDASTDGSLEACLAFARLDPRVTVVAQRERLGWIGNYNALLALAEGKYFVWLAHDDLYESCYVSALAARLEAEPQAVVAYSGGKMIEPDGRSVGPIPTSARFQGETSRFARGMRFIWWAETAKGRPFRGVMRTEALRRTSGLRNVRFAADSLLVFELALLGEIALDPRRLYYKHVYPESVSRNYGRDHAEWLEYFDGCLDVVRGSDLAGWQRAALTMAVRARRRRLILRRATCDIAGWSGWSRTPSRPPST